MAETLRELVVALSLDSSNFSRNMRTINQQIKEAESTFRLAGAGVQNYEKTIAGAESKLSMLGQKLTQQQRAVEQYSRALVAANDMRNRVLGYEWKDDQLVIVPEEAAIVKRIFQNFLDGKSRLETERELNSEGITTKSGCKWVDSNIKVILTNCTYTGDLLLQKE